MSKVIAFGICDLCGKQVRVIQHGSRFYLEIVFEGLTYLRRAVNDRDVALQDMSKELIINS